MARLQHRARFSSPSAVAGGSEGDILTLAAPSATAIEGITYNSAFVADGGEPPYTYALSGTPLLPTGLSLNTGTGAITGTPTVPGTYPFTGFVSDAAGHHALRDCTIIVNTASAFVASHPRLPMWSTARLATMAAARDANTPLYATTKSVTDNDIAGMSAFTHCAVLSSSISAAATSGTFTVGDASVFPSGSAFKVRIGIEVFNVTSRAGNTCTWNTRGNDPSNGMGGYWIQTDKTPLSAHASGEPVFEHQNVSSPYALMMGTITLYKLGVIGYTGATGTLKARAALSACAAYAHVYYYDLSNFRWGQYFFASGFDGLYADLTAGEKAHYPAMMALAANYHLAIPKVDSSHTAQRDLETGWTANQGMGQMHGILATAAASYGDEAGALTRWNLMLDKFTNYMLPSLIDGPFSGGNTVEGAEYMVESQYQAWQILAMLKSAANLDYYTAVGNWPVNVAKFYIYQTRPNTTPAGGLGVFPYGDMLGISNFGDYGANQYHQYVAAQTIDYLKVADPTWASYVKYWLDNICPENANGYKPEIFLWYDHTVTAVNYKAASLPKALAIGGASRPAATGLISSFSAWDPTATWGGFYVGSHRWDHAHSEQNTYFIWRSGSWLTRNLCGYLWVDFGTWQGPGGYGGQWSEWPWVGGAFTNGVLMNNHSLFAYLGDGQAQGEPTMERAIVTSTYAYGRGDCSLVAVSPTDPWTLQDPMGSASPGFKAQAVTNDALTFKRDWLHVLPGVFVLYDRLTYANASVSPTKWMSIYNGDPTITSQNIALTVGSHGLVEDILVPTSATLTKTTLSAESPSLTGRRIQTVSGANTALDELFKVMQTGVAGFTAETLALLTSTNAYVTQCGTTILGAARGASVTVPISYVVSGTPLHYLMGFAATTYYKVTRAVNTITIAADDTTNRQQSNAAGILSFTL